MRLGPFIFRSKISYSANSLSVFLRLGLMDLSAGLSTFDAACFIRCLRVLVSFSWRMGKDAGFPLTPAGMTGGAWAWLRIRDSREFLITLAPAFGVPDLTFARQGRGKEKRLL